MTRLELDLNLDKKSRILQAAAREFAVQVVRPAGIKLDRLPDPADAIARDSVLWDVYRQFREQGFHRVLIPSAFGGTREDSPAMAAPLISEQMGYGDAGLGISLAACNMPFVLSIFSPSSEVREWAQQYTRDTEGRMIGCWAITEPEHGSDWVLGTTPAGGEPKQGPSLKAVKRGDEYILNGQKSAWVSNGTIASHAMLHLGLDHSRGMHGQAIAFCPLDLPGITRGKPLDKIGQRPLNQGEIFFEDVKLHEKYLLIAPGVFAGNPFARTFLGMANCETSIVMSGLAQAALDEALFFVRRRIEGGTSIPKEQAVRLKLFKMFAAVESTHSFVHQVAEYNHAKIMVSATGPVAKLFSGRGTFRTLGKSARGLMDLYNAYGQTATGRSVLGVVAQSERMREITGWGKYGIAAKIVATETAFNTASEAMQILGAQGASKLYPLEKIFRDARASMIEDGVNEVLALAASTDLV